MSRRGALVVALVAGVSTGGFSVAWAQTAVTSEEVLAGTLLGATDDLSTSIDSSAVLALNDEMRAFLRSHVNPGGTDVFRMQQLIDALMGTTSFKLEYDENTRIAAETFRLQRGNCLSFTTLFVAMARGTGLKADFQEVEIPPDWSTRTDVFVLNLHINVIVQLGASGSRAIDFNVGDFKSTYEVDKISDRRAIAHFFNNMGVERMQSGDTVDAVAFFRRAIIDGDGEFAPPWTNLGMLYRKGGFLEHAEAAYLQALVVDKNDDVAMSNLVSLYEMQGDQEKLQVYQKKVGKHRLRNPHLRYSLAREAFSDGDYDAAIEHLKQATRRVTDKPEYFFLLGVCYLMKGDEEKARRWTTKAEKVAETGEEKSRYSRKIEALMRASEGAS
jgi:Flp pilus assembly protein TadD